MAFKQYDWQKFSYDTLIDYVKSYNDNEENLLKIKKAYTVAGIAHMGAKRSSGEPFITHPTIVANFLALMRCDVDTICAGLLHDTIEDTSITKEYIEQKFGKDVADIVEGVTKINKEEFKNKEEKEIANIQKVINSLLYDPRIVIVKLADRLHNMLTLAYMTKAKQQIKAKETIEVYAPIANRLGMYRIQKELENACFKYLNPLLCSEVILKRNLLKESNDETLTEMLDKMKEVITDNIGVIGHIDSTEFKGLEGEELQAKKEELTKDILFFGDNESRHRIKHTYGIYDALAKIGELEEHDPKETIAQRVHRLLMDDEELEKIHDLRVIKLIFRDEDACFSTLRFLHKTYKHIDKYLKDYIENPKPNLYQSLHSTVVYKGKKVQFQIRTLEQEYRDTYGLAWELYKYEGPNARKKILEAFKKYPEYKVLESIKNKSLGLDDYKKSIDHDILYPKQIIVINKDNGDNISLNDGATIHDFAYAVGGDLGNHLVSAELNDEKISLRMKNGKIDDKYYPFDIKLKPGDEVSAKFDKTITTPRPNVTAVDKVVKILKLKK